MPGQPSTKCSSPFREDNSPSFSVYQNDKGDWRFKDFGQAGVGGDVEDFIGYAERAGYEVKEALKNLDNLPPPPPLKEMSRESKQLMWRDSLYKGELIDLWTVAKLRKLKLETIEKAEDLGFLRFVKWRSRACWCLTDKTLQCAQVRKMDGTEWAEKDDAKTITLPGSIASWPIGATTIPDSWDESYILTEGSGDFLASLQFTKPSQAVCAFMGATNRFNQETLKHFKGSTVYIIGQNDPVGMQAAEIWHDQLRRVADCYITELPKQWKDLNEAVSAGYIQQ